MKLLALLILTVPALAQQAATPVAKPTLEQYEKIVTALQFRISDLEAQLAITRRTENRTRLEAAYPGTHYDEVKGQLVENATPVKAEVKPEAKK